MVRTYNQQAARSTPSCVLLG